MGRKETAVNEIKKLHLEEVVLFAINNIPQADRQTLKLFLELVNAGGAFGAITHEQIVRKMQQVLKYVPNASSASLLILMDLLDIKPPPRLADSASERQTSDRNVAQRRLIFLFNDRRQPATVEGNRS